jgi:hypothetical protein
MNDKKKTHGKDGCLLLTFRTDDEIYQMAECLAMDGEFVHIDRNQPVSRAPDGEGAIVKADVWVSCICFEDADNTVGKPDRAIFSAELE